MDEQQENSTFKFVAGFGALAVVGVLGYLVGSSSKANSSKSTSDTTFTAEQKAQIEDVVVKLVRDKTKIFVTAFQEGMQKEQQKEIEAMAEEVTKSLPSFDKTKLTIGDPSGILKVTAFIDPACPHCHEFLKTALSLSSKTKDVVFNIIVCSMLQTDDSMSLAKAIYAAFKQDVTKAAAFMQKLTELPRGLNKAQLIETATKVGLDEKKFEADYTSDKVRDTIEQVNNQVIKLGISGFPTLFAENINHKHISIQPLPAEEYVILAQRLKMKEDISKPPVEPQKALTDDKKEVDKDKKNEVKK